VKECHSSIGGERKGGGESGYTGSEKRGGFSVSILKKKKLARAKTIRAILPNATKTKKP